MSMWRQEYLCSESLKSKTQICFKAHAAIEVLLMDYWVQRFSGNRCSRERTEN